MAIQETQIIFNRPKHIPGPIGNNSPVLWNGEMAPYAAEKILPTCTTCPIFDSCSTPRVVPMKRRGPDAHRLIATVVGQLETTIQDQAKCLKNQVISAEIVRLRRKSKR